MLRFYFLAKEVFNKNPTVWPDGVRPPNKYIFAHSDNTYDRLANFISGNASKVRFGFINILFQ